jgi:hypothetical protein
MFFVLYLYISRVFFLPSLRLREYLWYGFGVRENRHGQSPFSMKGFSLLSSR